MNRFIQHINRNHRFSIGILFGFLLFFLNLTVYQSWSGNSRETMETKVSKSDSERSPIQDPDNSDSSPVGEEDQRDSPDEQNWESFYGFGGVHYVSENGNTIYLFSLKQLEDSYFNRRHVLLFVLHHSWRSFISDY